MLYHCINLKEIHTSLCYPLTFNKIDLQFIHNKVVHKLTQTLVKQNLYTPHSY